MTDEHGIDHEAPFTTCPRVGGSPLDLRIGDNRLIRRAHDGGVEVHIGYYSEYQQRPRKLFAKLIYDRMKAFAMFNATKKEGMR